MKLSENWRSLFGSGDLSRGEDYYEYGYVRGLSAVKGNWTATVLGSEPYQVFVPGDPTRLEDMSCDCPRFANGCYCKHLAATCMTIEEQWSEDDEDAASVSTNVAPSLAELVQSVPESDLRALALEMLEHDELMRTQFVQRYGTVDVAAARRTLANQIEKAVWECGSRGYIDWHGALRFERKYNEIVASNIDPLIDRGELAAALELTLQLFESLQEIEIDDSDGFMTDALEDIRFYWNRLLELGDDAFACQMFDRIAAFVASPPKKDPDNDMFAFELDLAEDFLIERFADVQACSDRVLGLCDERIAAEQSYYDNRRRKLTEVEAGLQKAKASMRGSYEQRHLVSDLERQVSHHCFFVQGAHNELAKWTLVKLRVLATKGATEDELRAIAGDSITEERVCQFFVDRALAHGHQEEAVRLLRDCKHSYLESGDVQYPIFVSVQLADLLEGRDTQGMREELCHLLNRAGWRGAPQAGELWARLHQSYDEASWLAEREIYLARITSDSTRRTCLEAEGLYDQLMDDIEKSGLGTLYGHEEALVEHCPERVLKLYLDALAKDWTIPGNNRKSYRSFAARLVHIKTLPGGEEPVRKILATMRRRYANRPALLDELSQVDA